jgi:hypothetical protein
MSYKAGQLIRRIHFNTNREDYYLIVKSLGRDFYEVSDIENDLNFNSYLFNNAETNITILSDSQ